ncbi:hypothetical protein ACFY3N_11055 [Streptomyces sp. NPDC000348]|uniref:hypothetical protein n=1 Tax=Streptomyces sp. NPDC000348 TaxID=3364538 RepID=UPI0036C878A6
MRTATVSGPASPRGAPGGGADAGHVRPGADSAAVPPRRAPHRLPARDRAG